MRIASALMGVWTVFLLNASVAQAASCPKGDLEPTTLTLEVLIACVEELRQAVPPKGAVVAFDRESGCPAGWTEFSDGVDRFIIGAGNKYSPPQITGNPKYDKGGSETHTLSEDEIPTHDHGFNFSLRNGDFSEGSGEEFVSGLNRGRSLNATIDIRTQPSGSSRAHNNMPPFVALYFCKKD